MFPNTSDRESAAQELANLGTDAKGLMTARVGDWVVVEPVHVGEPRRTGQILELRHEDGTPPYLVRWSDSGHEAVVWPGPNAHIRPGSS